jgi:hypothetical protein
VDIESIEWSRVRRTAREVFIQVELAYTSSFKDSVAASTDIRFDDGSAAGKRKEVILVFAPGSGSISIDFELSGIGSLYSANRLADAYLIIENQGQYAAFIQSVDVKINTGAEENVPYLFDIEPGDDMTYSFEFKKNEITSVAYEIVHGRGKESGTLGTPRR